MITIDGDAHPANGLRLDGRQQTVYASARTRVQRLFGSDGTRLLCVQPLGPGAQLRLRRCVAMLQRLSGVRGLPQIAKGFEQPGVILLDNVDGYPLTSWGMPLEMPELTGLPLALAKVVEAMHERGVLHLDIRPANILISRSGQPYLLDFELTLTPVDEPRPADRTEMAGMLAYASPELTGRTNWTVDPRSDLYSLGATFYEISTGTAPFGDTDPLRLTHDHLVRIPQPPDEVNPQLPKAYSAIIEHLLEKEPGKRYQTAEGLVHDLERVQRAPTRTAFVPGERDLPLKLQPSSTVIGRDREIAELRSSFDDALAGRVGGVFISGPAGVGKTSFMQQLRPMVATAGGWIVATSHDEFRADLDLNSIRRVLRAVGRLLLSEPEDRLEPIRGRMLHALGTNAKYAALAPEIGLLLGIPAEHPGADLHTYAGRLAAIVVDVLRVTAEARPLVVMVDDLQWSTAMALTILDTIILNEYPGLIIVGAYRTDDVDAAEPWVAAEARWQQSRVPTTHIDLRNLPLASLTELMADMLRSTTDQVSGLADAAAVRTHGNPFDTIELVNAVRRDRILTPDDEGWRWDPVALRRYVGDTDVADLLIERARGLPPGTQSLLAMMACIGGQADVHLLQIASGRSREVVEADLRPALEEGLLLGMRNGTDEVRFRHDRVRQAVLSDLTPQDLSSHRLALARHLSSEKQLWSIAADQYLPVVGLLEAATERSRVVDIFRYGATEASVMARWEIVERLLAAAWQLVDTPDVRMSVDINTLRHAALLNLGRLEEADNVFGLIHHSGADPLDRVDVTCAHIDGLTIDERPEAALSVGVALLAELGWQVSPPGARRDEQDASVHALYQAIEDRRFGAVDRPDITDPRLLAAASLMNRLQYPAALADHPLMVWLTLHAARIWTEHGPTAALVGTLGHIAYVTISQRQDYRTGHDAVQRILAAGQARGYEPQTSQARLGYAISAGHWFEPLDRNIDEAYRARQGLIRGGDIQGACASYQVTASQLFDSAPSLENYANDIQSGHDVVGRVGNHRMVEILRSCRQLVGTLRGESEHRLPENVTEGHWSGSMAEGNAHLKCAIAAAIFADDSGLASHASAASRLLDEFPETYSMLVARTLEALALTRRIAGEDLEERMAALTTVDATVDWLAHRSADAPGNFRHLLRWLEAERSWALSDCLGAAKAFDAAQRDVVGQRRPWHYALINERAGRFHLANDMPHSGYGLIEAARQAYLAWGATVKVNHIDREFPWLRQQPSAARERIPADAGGRITSDTIDLLGILDASRAMSSETNLGRLRARVVDVLSSMTGATAVELLVWGEDENGWLRTQPTDENGQFTTSGGLDKHVALGAVRYAERTREPLLIDDATRDERFAGDPYFENTQQCSLLVVPILNRGRPQAMLLLENTLTRGAFSTQSLDGVRLIGGQLAVSLDNALLYGSLERKVTERTEALGVANRRLEHLSVTDPLTQLANRRKLKEFLDDEWRKAKRSRHTLGLAMIDVDHFKLYNDHYGHPAGDDCLADVAGILKATIRKTDLAARYGGEEFVIVLPNTGIDAARQLAERVRATIEGHAIASQRAPRGIVTVSIGVVSVSPEPGGAADHIIGLADAQMYEAKRAGRNRVNANSDASTTPDA